MKDIANKEQIQQPLLDTNKREDDAGDAAIVRSFNQAVIEVHGAGTFEEALHVLARQTSP